MMTVEPVTVDLTFLYFISFILIIVIGIRFSWYSLKNKNNRDLPSQNVMWEYYIYIGILSVLYGIFGVLNIISDFSINLGVGIWMAFVFLLSINMREIYYSQVFSKSERKRNKSIYSKDILELLFILIIIIVFIGEILLENNFLKLVEGITTFIFIIYGFIFGNKTISNSIIKGTGLDTLTRNLLPILLFSGLILVINLGIFIGLNMETILQIQLIFLIMATTSLMTATIKLRQNIS